MKTILTIILCILSISSFGQSERDFKMYYKSGKLEVESKYDKDCNCIETTEYFESGKVRSTTRYVRNKQDHNQLDRVDIIYFENGMIQIYTYRIDGAYSGRMYCNYENGQLAYENFYANKFKVGTWKIYSADGSLNREEIYTINKTPWDSNDDYALNKFYFNKKLAYTVELVAGRKTNLKIIDQESYDQLMAANPPTGKRFFMQNCAMCHNPNVDVVGPKLKGVAKNRPEEWLRSMIINGDALRKNGDKVAVDLYLKWNKIEHPNFERLSNEEVDAIIDYLKTLN